MASRHVVIAGGAILVCLGFCPKLMAVITSLPTPVINGVFAMVCMTLISNGVKMVKDTVMDDRATMILGVSVMSGVSTMILPDSVIQMASQFIQYFLSSGIAVGGTVAIVLQLLLPKTQESEAIRTQRTEIVRPTAKLAASGLSPAPWPVLMLRLALVTVLVSLKLLVLYRLPTYSAD